MERRHARRQAGLTASFRPDSKTVDYHLIAVGRLRRGPEKALYDHYAGRLGRPITVREVEEKRPLSGPELKKREGALLLGALPAGCRVIALDERGKTLSSVAFSDLVAAWRDEGVPAAAFVIGGADGLSDEVRARADVLLSLGKMTWPHMLVRGLIAEQLYRAQQIAAGHPYHRD